MSLLERVESLRRKLHKLIESGKSLQDCIELSQELDEAIIAYYKSAKEEKKTLPEEARP